MSAITIKTAEDIAGMRIAGRLASEVLGWRHHWRT
jgi:methionine aminopeptidase